jgi:hypothetical protein
MLQFTTAVVMTMWTINVSVPYQPMSLQISPHLNVVSVGARNCPDNTKSKLFFYGLQNGKIQGSINGISQAALARQALSMTASIAGVGWNKELGVTDVYGPGNFVKSFYGEPSMQIPTAISHDGLVSAYLTEPKPDDKHINNRTATLTIVDGKTGKPTYQLNVSGQEACDPQSVAMSSFSSSSNSNLYTIGAVLGSINYIIDYDTIQKKGTVVWSSNCLEVDVTISGRGNYFAITSGCGKNVKIYGRDSSFNNSFNNSFSLISTIQSPGKFGILQPMVLTFDRHILKSSFLAIVWGDATGTKIIVTTHIIKKNKVNNVWETMIECPNGKSFDYVMQSGFAMSDGGEYVAMGDWGCQADNPTQNGNIFVYQGRDGDGTAMLNKTVLGQIWAVDISTKTDENKTIFVSSGSWSSEPNASPAQISTWSVSLP